MNKPLCQVCGEQIEKAQCVYCDNCATPHHLDCWNYVGHCSTFACGSKVNSLRVPKVGSPKAAMMNINEAGESWIGNRRVWLQTSDRPHTVLAHVDGTYTDTERRHVRLDLDTPLESFLQSSAMSLAFLSVFLSSLKVALYGKVLMFFALLMLFIRFFVECTYVLDNVRQEILYSRSIFGLTETWKICDFTEVKSVALSARKMEVGSNVGQYQYCAVLELPYGVHVQISDETTEHGRVAGFCRQLAEHLGTRALITSHDATKFNKEQGNLPMKVSNTDWRTRPFIGRTNLSWVIFFLFLLILNVLNY